MTDKELLELAAKAAGIDQRWDEKKGIWIYNQTHWAREPKWNPLTDDGDALRLAVKVLNWPFGGRAFDNQVTAMFAVGKLPKDRCEATRLAIVRAAADIGKTVV